MGTTVGMGDSDHAAVHLSVSPQAHYSRVFFLFLLSARGTDTAVISSRHHPQSFIPCQAPVNRHGILQTIVWN